MDRIALNTMLLEARLTIMELIVGRMVISLKVGLLSRDVSEALRESLEEYEGVAKALETSALGDSRVQHLAPEERALVADEYREMVERMKTQLRSLFPNT